MILAVHNSRIEPRLRHLAATLAFFAHDDGSEVRPGMRTLTKALGVSASVVYEGLQALVESHVIKRDGLHGHTRRFKFDLERLANYEPATDRTREVWRETVVRPRSQPYAVAEGPAARSIPETLRRGGVNGTPWRRKPSAVADLTLRRGGPDPNDLKDRHDHKYTGADAPDLTDEGTAETAEVPYQRLVEMAKAALHAANLDGNPSKSIVTALLERALAEGKLRCDVISQEAAIEAAFCAATASVERMRAKGM